MKKIKIFDWEVTVFELFLILLGGVYIGCFIRLNISHSIENSINLLSVSITFWGNLLMCILFRIGDIVHGKETKRMLEEMQKISDKNLEEYREMWRERFNEEPKEK